jgi:hypothetical protein
VVPCRIVAEDESQRGKRKAYSNRRRTMNERQYNQYIAPAPNYFKGAYNGTTIYFALSNHQMYVDPDFVGPRTKEEVIVPINWEVNGGEVKIGEMHVEKLLDLIIDCE